MSLKGKIPLEEKTGSGRLPENAKGQHIDTGRIGHTIEYLSGVAAKVSDGGGSGSASEEMFYPLPIFAQAGGSGGLFRRRRITGRYVPQIWNFLPCGFTTMDHAAS